MAIELDVADPFQSSPAAGSGNVALDVPDPFRSTGTRATNNGGNADSVSLDVADPFKSQASAKPDFSDVQSETIAKPLTPAPGIGELAKRGLVQGGAALMRTLQNVGDALNPGTSISNQLAESQMPEKARAAFHEQTHPLDSLAKEADEYAAPAPNEATPDLTGRVVQGAARLLPEVAGVIGSGGEGAVPEAVTAAARSVPYLGRVLGGIAEGLPTAAKFTAVQESNLPDTMTPGEKAKQTAKDFALNAGIAGLPAALGASPLVRVPTGAAIGAGQSAAISALSGEPQDAAQNIIGGLQGAAFGFAPHAPRESNAKPLPDSQVNAPGFESNPRGASPDQHVPETIRPGQTTRFVADANGNLREVPKQGEKARNAEPAQPLASDPAAAPAQAEVAAGRTPGPIASALAKAPMRAEDLPTATSAIDERPAQARTQSEPADNWGLSNPFDAFPEIEAARVPNGEIALDVPDPFRRDSVATARDAEVRPYPEFRESPKAGQEAAIAREAERTTPGAQADRQPISNETADRLARSPESDARRFPNESDNRDPSWFGPDVSEISSDELMPQEREAFDRQRSTVVNEHTLESAPPELRDFMAREASRSAVRDLQRQDSVQLGEFDADRLGLRSAVDTALGDSGIKVNFVRDQAGLPDSVKLSSLPESAQRSGLFDPDTKQAYVFTKVARTPEQAAFTAAHEIAGHNGLRALAASRPDVLVGGRTPEKALNDALDLALRNPTVAKIADSMASQRGSSDRYRMAEEAIADLAGATRTGDWARIKDRHGVDVSDQMRGAVRSVLSNFIDRVKQIVAKIFGHETFTDAQVHALIQDAWRASKDSSNGARGTALDSVHAGPASEDDLHEAYSIADKGAPRRLFQYIKDGARTVVSYKGQELGRFTGEPKRSDLTKAIQAKLAAFEPRSAAQPSPQGRAAMPPTLSPRRPGETRSAYVRRLVSGANADDVRAATSLKAQQKVVGRHMLREFFAKRQRSMDVADAIFGEFRKHFDRTAPADKFANIDKFETGKPIQDADFRAFLVQMKPGFQERIARLRELDPKALQKVIESYVPHMYTDPVRAAEVFKGLNERRSIAGDKGFLEHREWPTLKQAMASGLRPITSNPVDWVVLRYASMDKLIGSLELRKELNDRGWLLKASADENLPPGFKRVEDPAFNGYGVPAQFARDITNYLDPGFSKFAAWRTLRGIQNFMVAADLGFSGFHATFTSTDNVIMHLDVAARRAAIGDSRGAATTLVKALTSVATSPFEGHKLNQQWRGLRESDANTAAILDALERGGARWKMSTTEYQNAIPKLARTFRQMQGAGITAQLAGKSPAQIAVGAIKLPLTALQAVAETGSYLIHHVLVPNQKMAARVLLYKFELDRRAQQLGQQRGNYADIINAMHPDVVRQIAANVNDVVDYRLGQMTYDNRFWNRTLQDVAQAAVMAPGWQYGMIQTVAGAGKALQDIVNPGRFAAPLDKAGKVTDAHMGRVGANLSYFLTLALTLGASNSALQYLMTGKWADNIKDYFFPKTGRKNDDDSDERLQMPNYWRDHYALATEPVQTAENKIHPLLKMLWELGHNKDYFGTQIHDPNAPTLEQAKQVGAYIASRFIPITVGNINKGVAQKESTAAQVGHFFGVNDAPARVRRSDFQNFVTQGGDKGWGDTTKTPEEAQRKQDLRAAAAAIRRGEKPNYGNLSENDIQKAQADAQLPVPEMYFTHLSGPDKIKAFELATPEERQRYALRDYLSNLDLDKSAPFKRMKPAEQNKLVQRLKAALVSSK